MEEFHEKTFQQNQKQGQCSGSAYLRRAILNQRGDFYISDAVKIIIAVVLGALLLAALTLIFNHTVIPSVTEAIEDLFGS
jgi:hypothetical protein